MGGDFLSAKPVAGVDEAVGAAIDIGVVDLSGIADHDELGALRHAGDHGFGFQRSELLGFVEDEEAVRNGATSDVAESLDFKHSTLDELFVGLERLLAGGGCFLLLGGFALLLFALRGVLTVRAFWLVGMKRHEDFKGVVDRLKPGMELFVESAGEEAEGFAHGDHGAADGHAGVFFLRGEPESRADGGEGFARSCLAVAGDEGDGRVEQGVEEAELAEVGCAQLDATGHLEGVGHLESDEVSAADVSGRHEFLLGGGEEDILVDLQGPCTDFLNIDGIGAAKTLEFMSLDHDGADFEILDIGGGDFVVEIVLTSDADRHRLELHVEILGDENGWSLLGLHERDTGSHDPVINWFLVGKNLQETAHRRGEALAAQAVIDSDSDATAAGGFDPLGDFLGLVVEDLS